mgnify:CR=1 FL=1
MTNLGALAALAADNGTILWLNIYPRNLPQGMDPNMGFNQWGMAQVRAKGLRDLLLGAEDLMHNYARQLKAAFEYLGVSRVDVVRGLADLQQALDVTQAA